jgi:hypothetical protein
VLFVGWDVLLGDKEMGVGVLEFEVGGDKGVVKRGMVS